MNRFPSRMFRWAAIYGVIVLGDLNETRTPLDRLPPPAAAHRVGSIACLERDGFVDAWRCKHPDAIRHPGFTHAIGGARPSQSRIDYVWCKGVPAASLMQVHIQAPRRNQ